MNITAPANLPELLDLIIQFGIITLLFVFVLVGVRVFKILGAVQQITGTVNDIVETVNLVLWQPVKYYGIIMTTIRKWMKR
jgi:hypothetical protein